MSVAVIQGSSSGIGLALTRHLLSKTSLNVVATSRKPIEARDVILHGLSGIQSDRLLTLEVHVNNEDSLAEAARRTRDKYGDEQLRLLINVSGILKPEKSITKVNWEDALEVFKVNTMGHLMTFKHFVPLLPLKKHDQHVKSNGQDPAAPYVQTGLNVLASMSARVGSIGDNRSGGCSMSDIDRSSKAAVNQIIKTLNQELVMRAISPTIALALHPGTTAYTTLSRGFVKEEDVNNKKGVHDADTAARLLLEVIGRQGSHDGGKFLAYDGDVIPW